MKKYLFKKVATILLASILISLLWPAFSLQKNSENIAKATVATDDWHEVGECNLEILGTEWRTTFVNIQSIKIEDLGKTININAFFNDPSPGRAIIYKFTWKELEADLDESGFGTSYNHIYLSTDGTTKLTIFLSSNKIAVIEISEGSTDALFSQMITAFNTKTHEGDNFSTNSCNGTEIFGEGTFPSIISFHGDSAPSMRIGGRAADPYGTDLARPAMIFQLNKVLNKTGGATDDVIYYFSYKRNDDIGDTVEDQYKKFVIKLLGTGGNAFIAKCDNITDYKVCDDYPYPITNHPSRVVDLRATNAAASLLLFWNHVYNSDAAAGASVDCGTVTEWATSDSNDATKDTNLATYTAKPDHLKCTNLTPTGKGWLAHWGVSIETVSLLNPSGIVDVCDKITGYGAIRNALYQAFCSLGMSLADWADSMLNNAFCFLKIAVGYESQDLKTCNKAGTSTSP